MQFPLNRSMQVTQEQSTAGPIRTILQTALFFFLSLILTALASVVYIFVFSRQIIESLGPDPSQEAIRTAINNDPSSVYFSLFATILTTITFLVGAKLLDKRSSQSFAFFKEKALSQYGIGVGIAALLMIVIYSSLALTGNLRSELNTDMSIIAWLLGMLGFMSQGLSEEVVMRGYLMNGLAPKWGVPLAMILNSGIFAALHLGNPGMSNLALFNLFLAGIFFSVIFYVTDNMWLTGALHSFWNFIMGMVFGVQVSGLQKLESIWNTDFVRGKELFTGGAFGFEGGLVVTIVMLLAIGISFKYRAPKQINKI